MNNILKAPKLLKNTFSSKGSPMSLYLCETDKWRPTELIHYFDQNGNYIHYSDLYADILTTRDGTKQSPDDFYFVRVSDLLEKFSAGE